MDTGKARQGGHVFIELGVVLHGTGAKRIEARIDAKVALREMGIVTYNFDLADFGQWRGLFAQHIGRNHAL